MGDDQGRHFFSGGRHGRGAVDDDGARPQAFQDAVVSQQHRLDLRGARHTQNDHVRLRREGLGCGAGVRTRRQQRVQRLVARVFQDGEVVAMLEQIARDAVAHHANADHADVGHVCFL